MKSNKTKAIIPAAGRGTRMGMKFNESKEMIIEKDKYIIDYSLDLCEKHNIDPLIITRKEKIDLIEYTKDYEQLVLEEPTSEWPETILKSKHLWAENNILILPDTRFFPTDIIVTMEKELKSNKKELVVAVHKVQNGSEWGCIRFYSMCEKPKDKSPSYAWGLLGFKKNYGEELFENMSKRHVWFDISKDCSVINLQSFNDITRGKKK